MGNVYKINNKVPKIGNKVFASSSTLTFSTHITSTVFPTLGGVGTQIPYIILDFDSPQTITVNYGDSQIISYNTFLSSISGLHRIRFSTGANVGEIGAIAPRTFLNSGVVRNVFISFNKSALKTIQIYGLQGLNYQSFIFPFSEYANLEILDLQSINISTSTQRAFSSLDFRNIENSKLIFLGLRNVFRTTSEFYTKIDTRVFQLSLKTLIISGEYQNYTTSNAALIGTELADTLENLTFSVPITQANGLPSSFANLIHMKSFTMVSITTSFNLISFPIVANNWLNLEEFLFNVNTGNSAMTSFACNFSNMPKLKLFSMWGNITNLTDFTFISQLQSQIKTISLTGISNASKMTTVINELYNLITSKASITGNNTLPYRGIKIELESVNGWTAAVIPTGIYQAPSGYVKEVSNGIPANDLHRIFVLVDQYNCNITYRTV